MIVVYFFFFNDTATTEIYTLSLHDALPILLGVPVSLGCVHDVLQAATRQASVINRDQDLSGIRVGLHDEIFQGATPVLAGRSEEHTSELQSRQYLVCRLLLEKKK